MKILSSWAITTPALLVIIALNGCGKPDSPAQQKSSPASTQPTENTSSPPPVVTAPPTSPPTSPPKPSPHNAQDKPDDATSPRRQALALAQKSGCLACHKIDKKLVGPAWQDVAKKYKGDAGAKAGLIEKVKKGGKGNWTEITNGAAMPPYSPRVKDEDIEKLVDFVLSLAD